MSAEIDSKEARMAFPNGITVEHEILITTLDVLEDDGGLFNLELIKCRLFQGEKQKELQNESITKSTLTTTP